MKGARYVRSNSKARRLSTLEGLSGGPVGYDITVRFAEKYVDRFSRTKDQMVQAARSGVQNIAEGSQASATSKKTELKLTQVARASLEELRLDYEDFLLQRNLSLLNLACWFLDRQVEKLANDFENNGGFTERLYKVRSEKRRNNH